MHIAFSTIFWLICDRGRFKKSLLNALIAALSCAAIYSASANQVAVTGDFDFGTWSPFFERWQKSVPVCVWDSSGADLLYNVQATGLTSNKQFELRNNLGETIPYHLYWLDESNSSLRSKLSPNLPTNNIFRGDDLSRCESGPSGNLQMTLDTRALGEATPSIYTDTIVLTISAL